MAENYLEKLFEHNNWANLRIIRACADLSDEQLDAGSPSATKGSIRRTLWHLVNSQAGYVSLLTGTERRFGWEEAPSFAELEEGARASGEGLLALARGEFDQRLAGRLRTWDDWDLAPWVVVVQVINHAHEHREQISSMLSALGVAPPDNAGWTYGEATGTMVPASA